MNSQDFIIESIDRIVNQYPFVQCTYQFDRFCALHSIEVLPKCYLNSPDGFGEIQYKITKEFISLFPHERISFFTKGNSIEIENEDVVYCAKGKFFIYDNIKDSGIFPEYKVHISNAAFVVDKEVDYAFAA